MDNTEFLCLDCLAFSEELVAVSYRTVEMYLSPDGKIEEEIIEERPDAFRCPQCGSTRVIRIVVENNELIPIDDVPKDAVADLEEIAEENDLVLKLPSK